MKIQRLNNFDIPDLLSLCESVGWLQPKSFMQKQFELYLSIGTLLGYIKNKKLIAAGGVFPFQPAYSSIGMLIVHPNFQRQGIGRALLEHCLQFADSSLPTILIATDAGVPLYQSFRFETITNVHRFEKLVINPTMKSRHFKTITPRDFDSLIQLDQTATGANRRQLYSLLLPRIAFSLKLETNGTIDAFTLCIQKGNILCVTPLIAKKEEDAILLLQQLSQMWNGVIRIDVPQSHITFRTSLQNEQFQETLRSPLMIRNGKHLPGNRDMLFTMIDATLC
ncbi:GNAT family N-acetyltransferase [Bacillus cytotoxicus]